MTKSFFDFFPVPDYLTFPAIGIDIGADSIKFVELVKNKNGISLGKHGKKIIPNNSVGEFDGSNVSKILASVGKEFKINYAHFSLPEEQSYFVKLSLPSMDMKDLRGSIELQLEENVPYTLSEMVFDYEITGISKNGDFEINVSVLPLVVVNKYLNVLKNTEITPLSFEIEAESIARAVVPKDSSDTVMVINVGDTETVLAIVNCGIVWLSYTIKMGGDFFSKSISEGLSIDIKEAERLKFSKGFIRNVENQELLFTVAPAISSLRDEILKHYWYWNEHKDKPTQANIDKILLCGSQAGIKGFSDYLSASLNLSVSLANPWSNVFASGEVIPEISFNDSLEFSTAIGLALRGIGDFDNK
ncbi:MAG: pilus assembly protein PilM [bacterium]